MPNLPSATLLRATFVAAASLLLQSEQGMSESTFILETMRFDNQTLINSQQAYKQNVSANSGQSHQNIYTSLSKVRREKSSMGSVGRNTEKQSKRRRRHSRRHNSRQLQNKVLGFKTPACPTSMSIEFKTEAVDIFGHKVQVMPDIYVGLLKTPQFFHESYCTEEKCNCAGIDSDVFKSSCETSHTHTYAMIVKNGEIGWSYIKMRSGCACSIQEKVGTFT